jgi:hypothetical protein
VADEMAGSASSRRRGRRALVGWILVVGKPVVREGAAARREVATTVVCGRVRRRVVRARPIPWRRG